MTNCCWSSTATSAGYTSPCVLPRSRTAGKFYSCIPLVLESSEVGEKETGLASESGPCEYFENYISDGLEFELVTYGQHEDLVLVVLLNVVFQTSLINGRLLDDIGQTASVASLEAQAILKLIGDAQGD